MSSLFFFLLRSIISGDTGCGKSTLIPQLVCDAENLVPDDKVVVCTQPRRVAAITLAEYVARDRGQELGDEVGYQIRFINKFCESTRPTADSTCFNKV